MAKETIAFESLPPSAQKSYKVINVLRKGAMFLGWVTIVLLFLDCVIFKEFDLSDPQNIIGLFVWGGVVSGWIHGGFLLKNILKKAFSSIFIPFWIGGIVVAGVLVMILAYGGFIFLGIDTVRFIKKKPLIYSFEHSQLIQSEKAQMEILQDALSTPTVQIKDDSEVAMENLEKLNGMHEKGLITDEEFETKKAQLLQRI